MEEIFSKSRNGYPVKLIVSGRFMSLLPRAAKACATARDLWLALQVRALEKNAPKHLTASTWTSEFWPVYKRQPRLGYLDNVPFSVHMYTAAYVNKDCRSAFRSKDKERLPKYTDSEYEHIRYGSDVTLDRKCKRLQIPKMDWIRYETHPLYPFKEIEGVPKQTIIYKDAVYGWCAFIVTAIMAPVASKKVANQMLKYSEAKFRKVNPLQITKDQWVERFHDEREVFSKENAKLNTDQKGERL